MTIPLTMRFDILERDHYTCRFCGKRAPETELEVDHVMARSKGGSDDKANLVTTCRDCNRGKGDRTLVAPESEWGSLVGKFFHIPYADEHYVQNQGWIMAALGHDHYVIQLFEWLTGSPSFNGKRVVHISRIAEQGWYLYDSADAMDEAYKYGGLAKVH